MSRALSAPEFLAYIKEHYELKDGVFYWIKKPNKRSRVQIGEVVGCRDTQYRAWKHYLLNKNVNRARLVWLLHYETWPDGDLFHANGDILDDRLENLKLVKRERKPKPAAPVVPPGVVHMPRRGVWRVDLSGRHIGDYPDLKTAMTARERAMRTEAA